MTRCPDCDAEWTGDADCCPRCSVPTAAHGDGDLSGTEIDGRYTVERRLGQGGMGTVYVARQKVVDRQVALKVLRPELAGDPVLARRFLREARAVAALRNPHTVTLHDFGRTADGRLFFTMELLHGQPLATLMAREGALPWARAVGLALQACESLREAHGLGILHRDLKPDNLFLVDDGSGNDHLKVLDFGLARSAEGGETLTRPGATYGTPAYMSPEQAAGKPLDARSDLYSLAVVLYEMLAGALPFESDTPLGFLVKHATEPPRDLKVCRPAMTLPPPLEALVMRTLAKAPGERPPSAEALASGLREVLQDGITAAVTSPGRRGKRPIGTGAVLAGAAVLAIALLGGGYAAIRLAGSGDAPVSGGPVPASPRGYAPSPERAALDSLLRYQGDPPVPAGCRALDPDAVDALLAVANPLLAGEGSTIDRANATLAALDALPPEVAAGAEALWLRSRAGRLAGHPADAVAAEADRARERCPGFAAPDREAGAALVAAERSADATVRLERALQLAPEYAAARFNLALARAMEGRNEDALAELGRVLAQDSRFPGARWTRARLLVKTGRGGEAREDLEAVVRNEPGLVDAWTMLAKVRMEAGDEAGAREALEARQRLIAP